MICRQFTKPEMREKFNNLKLCLATSAAKNCLGEKNVRSAKRAVRRPLWSSASKTTTTTKDPVTACRVTDGETASVFSVVWKKSHFAFVLPVDSLTVWCRHPHLISQSRWDALLLTVQLPKCVVTLHRCYLSGTPFLQPCTALAVRLYTSSLFFFATVSRGFLAKPFLRRFFTRTVAYCKYLARDIITAFRVARVWCKCGGSAVVCRHESHIQMDIQIAWVKQQKRVACSSSALKRDNSEEFTKSGNPKRQM